MTVEVKTDQFPKETSWNIKNANGTILVNRGNYTLPQSLYTLSYCLPAGCYTFNISDTYGDGILSVGYFKVLQGTTVLLNNNPFNTIGNFSFCLGNITTPTCIDGIKNGNETGIDCGGSCPACPTCSDGIKNGNETGVDCGGSCPACPTCSDGIKNGNETGIDCGGSCPACPTCFDGIMNGNETAIDCGGNCTSCPTCSDGIKNGNETAIDCGGSCQPCLSCINMTLEIRTDQFPTETSWNLKNGVGTTVASGGNYVSAHTLFTYTYCLPPGCYTFKISDSYGDGILSPGYFKISEGTKVFFNNNAFASFANLNFCLGTTPAPTCTDGIKNGNEIGVDCGGSCPACPTCTDGIKNGNETGVDCGGSCPACPTCTDGIKNGNETGVDCGGSCPACPTCTDGIKNGNETGIDCGGSCLACPTCTDGIKNGSETGLDCGGSCPACPTCTDGIKNGNETGIDCGGNCPSCASCINMTVEVRTDQYPTETTWNIKNANGTIVASGGNYTLPNTLNIHSYCLPIGCYSFNISDIFGDGILSPGYFRVLQGTTVLLNNNTFTTASSFNFCLINIPVPTCTDGIKNGNETAIDCGGSCPTCPPCINTTVEIRTDQFPNETSWNIKNASGTILAYGGNYTLLHTLNLNTYCLPLGCYTFHISDSFGDGILSPGYFRVLQGTTVLLNNNPFNTQANLNFCLTNSGNLQPESEFRTDKFAKSGILILPNPTKNMVSIITEEQILKIQLYNLSGQMLLVQPTLHENKLDLSSLIDGVYIIQVQTEKDIYMDRLIKM